MLLSSLFIALFTIIQGIPHISAVCNKLKIEGIVRSPEYNGVYSVVKSSTCFYKTAWGKQANDGDVFIYYKEIETSWVGWVVGDGLCSSQYRVRGSESGGEDPVSVEKWEEYTGGDGWLHNDDILFQCKDSNGLSTRMIVAYVGTGVTFLVIICCCVVGLCCSDYVDECTSGSDESSEDSNDKISFSLDQLPTYEEGVQMPRSRANTVVSIYDNVGFVAETEFNEFPKVTVETPPLYVDAIHMPVLAENPLMTPEETPTMTSSSSCNTLRRSSTSTSLNGSVAFIIDDAITVLSAGGSGQVPSTMTSSSSCNTLRRSSTSTSLNGSVAFIIDDAITVLSAGGSRQEQKGHTREGRDHEITDPQKADLR